MAKFTQMVPAASGGDSRSKSGGGGATAGATAGATGAAATPKAQQAQEHPRRSGPSGGRFFVREARTVAPAGTETRTSSATAGPKNPHREAGGGARSSSYSFGFAAS